MTTEATPTNDPNPGNVEDTNTLLIPAPDTKAPEPAKVEPAKVEPVESAVAFEQTGDVGLDMALEFLGKQGYNLEHPAMVAAGSGDFTVLEALLAQKGVQGWQQMVALGKAGYERVQNGHKEAANKTLETVTNVVGGKEEWAAIQSWARDNASDAERTEINSMFNAGGLQAKTAALYLKDAYNRANNVNVTPPEGRTYKGADTPKPASGPLSAADYTAAVADLHRKLGGRMESSKEYQALGQRRIAAMR
jgi:hypothetical protein